MKRIILCLVIIVSAFNCYSQSVTEWQTDLRYLQNTVHSNYSNLFHTISEKEWNKTVDDFYLQIPEMDNDEIIAGFVKLVALFRIGHTRVNTGSLQFDADNIRLHTYPFQMYQFSDGVYILRADKKYEQAVGGKVLKIGNMEIGNALETITPLANYENEFGLRSNIMYYLTVPEFLKAQGITESKEELEISYLMDDKEETIVFKAEIPKQIFSVTGLVTPDGWTEARKSGDRPLWQKEGSAYRYMEYIPEDKILYVRHSAVNNDSINTIESFFEEMENFIAGNDVQKLILDLRQNGGGNNYLNKPVITSIIRSDKINQSGKFYCIIGRRTFSAAQNLVNELENYTEVIFVGEPTSENVNFYGDTRIEILPNSKIPVRLSWLWWQNKDPRDNRDATYPDLAVDMSYSDYYNNEDPVIEVIKENNEDGLIDNKLRELAEQGKLDQALSIAKEYLKDPLHRYYKSELEEKINNFGYSLIGKSELEKASFILNMNIQLFPESANAYDSYAESLWKLGKTDEAIKYYEIAISKDEAGATAANSKKMIEEIKRSKQ